MNRSHARSSLALLLGRGAAACALCCCAALRAHEPPPPPLHHAPNAQPPARPRCDIDFTTPEGIRDTVSNVLLRAEVRNEAEVRAFLNNAVKTSNTGAHLRDAAADHFKIDRKRFEAQVEYWRHINCRHEPIPGYAVPDAAVEAAAGKPQSVVPVSVFAADVTLHVVLHELGHAVIREFDLMVLGNEETMADAFATHMLTEHFPERAPQVLAARVASLMIEANEVPRDQWTVRGEHDSDARRAFQIAALAIAADKDKYASVADLVEMSDRDRKNARDYGSDIHRAWRRTLAPLLMPPGAKSKEARFLADSATLDFVETGNPSLRDTIESALQRIDWHSQVTVTFVAGTGGAAWSRSSRTITVNGEYLRRFIAQGVIAENAKPAKQP